MKQDQLLIEHGDVRDMSKPKRLLRFVEAVSLLNSVDARSSVY